MTESLGEYTEDTEDAASEKDRIVYRIEESMVGSSFQAVCPELLITAFGDSPNKPGMGCASR